MKWLLALCILVILLQCKALRGEDRTIVELLKTLDQVSNAAARCRALSRRFELQCKAWISIISDRNLELAITRAMLEDEIKHNKQLVDQLAMVRRTRDGYKFLYQRALEARKAPAKPPLAIAK